ncbi:MAG: glycosyltransferase [Coriobacteriia bacterium]|nr:glycosyltransferase [Coriobacteriia bacterium]
MIVRRLAYLCLQATTEGQASHAHVHEIISGLRELGWQVDLFEPAYAGGRAPGILGRLAEFGRVQRRLVRVLRGGGYDALYVRGHALAWPAATMARRLGVPVVQECNGPYDDFYTMWPQARLLRWLIDGMTRSQFRHANARIAVTPELAAWIERETGRATDVIGNGANDQLFRPDAPRPEGIDLPERYAVFFGALSPWQGVDLALAAVAGPAWPDGVDLVFLGDGVRRPAVDAASTSDSRVHSLGTLPYSVVPGVVAGALCSLVLSDRQGDWGLSPLKLYESMACGVPVIVPDRPGSASTVREHDCGVVLDDATPYAVGLAVGSLALHPDKAAARGHRGRDAVEAKYSWRSRANATAGIIGSALR